MGASHSAFDKSLIAALGGNSELYAFPNEPLYQPNEVKPYNQDIAVAPAAATYPKTAEQVAAIIKCAVQAGLKVQARCGGHSYANYCATLALYLLIKLTSDR